jgi:hypothetical protein
MQLTTMLFKLGADVSGPCRLVSASRLGRVALPASRPLGTLFQVRSYLAIFTYHYFLEPHRQGT